VAGLNVRQAEALAARQGRSPQAQRLFGGEGSADVTALGRTCRRLGLKVSWPTGAAKGDHPVGTLEQLDDLCRRLMRAKTVCAGLTHDRQAFNRPPKP
jgi:hypothetical protein